MSDMLPLSVYEPQLVEAAEVINELREGTEVALCRCCVVNLLVTVHSPNLLVNGGEHQIM